MKINLIDVSYSAIDNTAIITLKTNDKRAVDSLIALNNQIKQNAKDSLECDFKKYKSKRSVEQNRLMWELLDMLSYKVNGIKDSDLVWQMYIEMLERTGQKSEYFNIPKGALKMIKKAFRATRELESNEETVTVQCFYGSSTFNTKEMTAFIDSIIVELKGMGVEI